jgi:hypothetical protein
MVSFLPLPLSRFVMKPLLCTLLLLPGIASAVPSTVVQQGRILGSDGTPINGPVSLDIQFWTSRTDGTSLWFGEADVVLSDGYYAVVLGQSPTPPLTGDVLTTDDVWVGVRVGTSPELTRTPLTSAPFALVAGSVDGGSVDASEVRIAGTEVINAQGQLLTATPSFCAYNNSGANRSTTGIYVANVQTFEHGGDNYSTANGRFTAPYDGVYAFSWATYTHQASGRTFLVSTEGTVIQTNGNGQGLSASVSLTTGQQIWLSGTPSYPMTWYGSAAHNLFCGHLVHRF